MWLKWLPWKFVIRRIARASGFVDPVAVLAQLHRFAQPSEVAEPIELLRAGVVFHARGLINSRVIQHNLDWVWPYWVERQFDPRDPAFVPRAFSVTHVNLTHRNWTAIGVPDCADMPIVDPGGLVTPHFDRWSLEGWVLSEDGISLLPSRSENTTQQIAHADDLMVATRTEEQGLTLTSEASVECDSGEPVCRLVLRARADAGGWAVVALRPYNPEGISFIHDVTLSPERRIWTVDGRHTVEFNCEADRHHVSNYHAGDVYIHLRDLEDQDRGECGVGMVTAAALFRLSPGEEREIVASAPLDRGHAAPGISPDWTEALRGHCALRVPDQRVQSLYETALRTLVLHSPGDVFAGPFTYKRFWFRDAAFILHA
ncbi:MAG: hypothetical protein OER92_06745, partial [Alphaproteobacteria bacterium]|nr:hypothetical protein [Alphaproteobacteria bacterium]